MICNSVISRSAKNSKQKKASPTVSRDFVRDIIDPSSMAECPAIYFLTTLAIGLVLSSRYAHPIVIKQP